ncbi:MAG: hypothetical protein FJ123_06155 [Deltaproteobacteria bacterium]|nr:hypothetical protein [Deltaproteobacteria bacterium]
MESIPSSFDSFRIFFLLLPGFVSLLVERSMLFQPKDTALFSTIKALVYSFLNYTIFSFTGLQVTSRWAAIAMLVIAIITGLLIGYSKSKDWHMELARKFGLTRTTARPSVWLDIFQDKYSEGTGPYVIVFLKDGRRIYGWPEYYANEYSNGPILFLTKAGWLYNDGVQEKEIQIPDPGILINGSQIIHIQFYRPAGKGAQNAK